MIVFKPLRRNTGRKIDGISGINRVKLGRLSTKQECPLSEQLAYSVFQDVFFPPEDQNCEDGQSQLRLESVIRYAPHPQESFPQMPLVVFDFETTGLDSKVDKIIEIGAIRLEAGKPVAEFSTLINPDMKISEQVTNITGITEDMLEGQPNIKSVLPDFIEFFKGAVLVAHNADFDMGFLHSVCLEMGWRLQWPAYCTLKMARQLLPQV